MELELTEWILRLFIGKQVPFNLPENVVLSQNGISLQVFQHSNQQVMIKPSLNNQRRSKEQILSNILRFHPCNNQKNNQEFVFMMFDQKQWHFQRVASLHQLQIYNDNVRIVQWIKYSNYTLLMCKLVKLGKKNYVRLYVNHQGVYSVCKDLKAKQKAVQVVKVVSKMIQTNENSQVQGLELRLAIQDDSIFFLSCKKCALDSNIEAIMQKQIKKQKKRIQLIRKSASFNKKKAISLLVQQPSSFIVPASAVFDSSIKQNSKSVFPKLEIDKNENSDEFSLHFRELMIRMWNKDHDNIIKDQLNDSREDEEKYAYTNLLNILGIQNQNKAIELNKESPLGRKSQLGIQADEDIKRRTRRSSTMLQFGIERLVKQSIDFQSASSTPKPSFDLQAFPTITNQFKNLISNQKQLQQVKQRRLKRSRLSLDQTSLRKTKRAPYKSIKLIRKK